MEQKESMHFIASPFMAGCPCFVRNFQAAGVRRAVLEITGLGLYRAFLNGERIGEDWLTPGCNDYDAYVRVQAYEVTGLLKAGENCLEVVVGDGWYRGRFGLEGKKKIWGDGYLLAARLQMDCEDGEILIETDEEWGVRESCIRETSIYDGEIRDDTLQDATIIPCRRVDFGHYMLEKDVTPAIRCKEVRKAELILSPSGEQILDFGQNMAGVVRFRNSLPQGRRVCLQYGEVLQEGCFYRDNLRSAVAEYVYISDGTEKLVEPWFTYYGFRYVKVEGVEYVNPADYEALVLSSDLAETLTVETDSPKINRLMKNTLWSQRSNFLDVPTDCPQRDERLGWTADTQVFMDTACYQMDCKAFYSKYLRDLRIDQTRYFHGGIPAYSPSLKGSGILGGAAWSDAAVIIPWKLYRQYGDRRLLEEHYPLMFDYVETLVSQDRDHGNRHLIDQGFTFGDWLALDGKNPQSPLGATDATYIRSVYYWNSVRMVALTAGELGKGEEAEHYGLLADAIRDAILQEFFTPAGHLWRDTQTACILALYFGLYRNREVLIKDFRERLQKDGFRLKCGFVGTPLLLPALLDNGMEDEAFRLLYNEEFPGWLYEVNLGATTIWERWDSMLPDGRVSGTGMNSFNHYAYGSVCGAIYSKIAGLKVGDHGWRSAVIEPHFHWRMKKISLCFQSPAGEYRVSWKTEDDDTVTVAVQIPDHASALVKLPDRECFRVGSGNFIWNCKPQTSLCTPFSTDTVLMDLMQCPAAREVIQKKLPSLADSLTQESELWARSLGELGHVNPNLAGIQLDEVQELLKTIRV